jgi:hypothetical protein
MIIYKNPTTIYHTLILRPKTPSLFIFIVRRLNFWVPWKVPLSMAMLTSDEGDADEKSSLTSMVSPPECLRVTRIPLC